MKRDTEGPKMPRGWSPIAKRFQRACPTLPFDDHQPDDDNPIYHNHNDKEKHNATAPAMPRDGD